MIRDMNTSTTFDSLVREDPLFAAEGLDIQHTYEVLDETERTIRDIEQAYIDGSFWRGLFFVRYPLARYAVPLSFLRSLCVSEEARRAYLKEPSDEHARALLAAWTESARAYENGANDHVAFFKLLRSMEKDRAKDIQDMVGNVFTPRDVETGYELLLKNADALKAEVMVRSRLLDGDETVVVSRRSRADESRFAYRPGTLTPELQRVYDLVLRYKHVFRDSDIEESYGPFEYTLKNYDTEPTPHLFYIYLLKRKDTGFRHLRVYLADQYYFLQLIPFATSRFGGISNMAFTAIIERGIPYWCQSATNFYAMRDQQYWAGVATVADLKRRPGLDARLVAAEQCSLLDQVLAAAWYDLKYHVNHTKDRIRHGVMREYSKVYGFLTQANPSIYFLPFNLSVWRLDESINFLCTRAPLEDQLYKTWDMVSSQLDDETLERVLQAPDIREADRKRRGLV